MLQKDLPELPVAVNFETASYQNQTHGESMKVNTSDSCKAVQLNETQHDKTGNQVKVTGSCSKS